ncbi:MAG: UDP-glucuronic acid dehydrogenase [Methylophaga sp.]|nr:UDP-glucuronic acid dehydrogenase [Methylophaga sp.]
MNITILCSSSAHPINKWLKLWVKENLKNHNINIVRTAQELRGGDILFLISCSEIITKDVHSLFRKILIIHASDLPKGRGWSPHVWEIIAGASEITLSLLEMECKVDSGDIWQKLKIQIEKTDLHDDINSKIFDAEMELMDFALENIESIRPSKQDLSIKPTYHGRRTPEDSELDIKKSIESNFDLLRVCDPARFPAFFYLDGMKYRIYIEKDNDN